MKFRLGTLFAFIAVTAAYADRAALPDSSYLGLYKSIAVGSQINGVNPGGGGAFNGYISNGTTNWNTTFWCVDSQLYFSPNNGLPPSTPNASVIRLDQILDPLYDQSVRYSQVTDGNSGSNWTNQSSLLPSSSIERYQLAAWLVTQYNYPGDPQDGLPTSPSPTTRNVNIQNTIWAVMHNNSHGGTADAVGTSSFANGGNWISAALANDANGVPVYKSIDLTKWAVVSWTINGSGTLLDDDRQTFLVQVVPEPGFYGLLALGLAGLGVMAQRRRKQEGV